MSEAAAPAISIVTTCKGRLSSLRQSLPRLREGVFYSIANAAPDAVGTVICRRADFEALEGYDEVLQDWGPEDRDLYIRLRARGCAHATLPGDWIEVIKHDDASRVNFYGIKDRWLSQRINASYSQIKHDLARQFGGRRRGCCRARGARFANGKTIAAHLMSSPLTL